jgi:hypothetical protein
MFPDGIRLSHRRGPRETLSALQRVRNHCRPALSRTHPIAVKLPQPTLCDTVM